MAPDLELTHLRENVHCATVLESGPDPWQLDKRQSTPNALKYRRGSGEIIIVSHKGRGWYAPTSGPCTKGDVILLLQHLEPGLSLGHVRQRLRPLAGLSPSFPPGFERSRTEPDLPVSERWVRRPRLKRGTNSWAYLFGKRAIPAFLIEAAVKADVVRAGPSGSCWFAYLDRDSRVTHVEIRGPVYKGSLRGGKKTLFRFPPDLSKFSRLILTEAPIDALSVAALENLSLFSNRPGTVYAATGGGMGPETVSELKHLLADLSTQPHPVLLGATDADQSGDYYADLHARFALEAGVSFQRMRPSDGAVDWNKVLVEQGRRT
jgi:hypothetical protein